MHLVVRRNQADLGDTEKGQFVDAVLKLKAAKRDNTNVYDQFVQVHVVRVLAGHRGPAFFAWHREFLRLFETALQTVGGMPPDLGLPYWDWSVDEFPAFLGPDGSGSDGKVLDGPFASDKWQLKYGPTAYLMRQFGKSVGTLPSSDDVANTLDQTPYDVAPWDDSPSTQGFRNRAEGWSPGGEPQMHNRVHEWVGGSMGPASSPNDPVFWLHHCYVDKLWADWQSRYFLAQEPYLPTDKEAPFGHNLNDPMPPWNNVTPKRVLDHHALGYRYDTDGWLGPGDELQWDVSKPWEKVSSPSGNCELSFHDGILFFKQGTYTTWQSTTAGPTAGNRCIMQDDGNLAILDRNNTTVWGSSPRVNTRAYLMVGDDGQLVIYDMENNNPTGWRRPPPAVG
jgi:Common central domain of tyrosinase